MTSDAWSRFQASATDSGIRPMGVWGPSKASAGTRNTARIASQNRGTDWKRAPASVAVAWTKISSSSGEKKGPWSLSATSGFTGLPTRTSPMISASA